METEQLGARVDVQKNIGILTFTGGKGNSLPGMVLAQLAEAFDRCAADETVKVVILRSSGKGAFCGGASFDELLLVDSEAKGKEFMSGFARVILAMRRCPKFIIAEVQGRAVGGGVGLIAASDYALAEHDASVRLSELALGIGPFVIGPAVERKVGTAAFQTMAIDADWHTAEWALRAGLFSDVCSSADELTDKVDLLAEKLALCSLQAMKELKAAMWEGTDHWEQLLFERAAKCGRLLLTEESRAAIAKVAPKVAS